MTAGRPPPLMARQHPREKTHVNRIEAVGDTDLLALID